MCAKKKINPKGSLNLRHATMFLFVMVFVNFAFASLSQQGFIECVELEETYTLNATIGNVTDDTEAKTKIATYTNLISGQCDNFPSWIYWLFQIIFIIGTAIIIRQAIGLT